MSSKTRKSLKKKKGQVNLIKAGSINNKKKILLGTFIACIGFIIYANTIQFEYVLDDFSVIKENQVVKRGVEAIPTIFTTNYRYGFWNSEAAMYRPLSLTMFAIEWEFFPDNPKVYHLVNVILYALTGFLIFIVLCQLFQSNLLLPFLAGLIYICHPIHTEVVANIKSRDEILVFFFTLISIYTLFKYLDKSKVKWLIVSLITFGLAIFSKENAISFLAIFPLLIYFFSNQSLAKNFRLSSLFLVPTILFLGTRFLVLKGSGISKVSVLDNFLMSTSDFLIQKATAIALIGKYFWTLLFPYQLCHEYGYSQLPLNGILDWQVLISLAVILIAIVYVFKQFKYKKISVFAVLFFIISFFIYSNLAIIIGSSYGERFLYIPSLGFAIGLTYLILRLFKVDIYHKENNILGLIREHILPVSLITLIAILYSVKTISRNRAWKNNYTLYSTDVKTAPNSAKLQYHYGLELVQQWQMAKTNPEKEKWIPKVLGAFNQAIKIQPAYHDAYGQLGLAYYRLGDLELAMKNYQLSLKYKEVNPNVYSNMGSIYLKQGKLEKGIESYKKAIQYNPRFVDAHRNLGSVYGQTKQFEKAIYHFKEALRYQVNDPTLTYYLYMAYRDNNDTANAEKYWQLAKSLNPNVKR